MTCQSKYLKTALLSFFSILTLVLYAYTTQNEKYIVKINVAEKKTPDKLIFSIQLLSKTKQLLRIPKEESLVLGYQDDESADCYFQVLEIKDSGEVRVSPTADYQHFNVKKKFTLLNKYKSIVYQFDLCNYYTLIKGKGYKIRLIFNLSKYNATHNISSEWQIVKM